MKRLSLFTYLLISVFLMTADMTAEVTFSSSDYDFGVINEDDGPVTGRVYMINVGPGPTYIRNVRTTCGCTDASFTEGMIEEGDSALVSFTYDPENRAGSFNKSVKVFVGQDNRMHIIRISGLVKASRRTLEANYPDSIGELRLSTLLIDGGELPKGESRNWFIYIYNPTDRTIRPTVRTDEDVISVAVEPQTIGTGETGVIGIYLNTRREEGTGEKEYEIDVCSDADAFISEMGKIKLGAKIVSPESSLSPVN